MKTKNKKSPSRGKLERFVGTSLRKKIDRMYLYIERQHKIILGLLDKISLEQYMVMNQNGKSYVALKRKGNTIDITKITKNKKSMNGHNKENPEGVLKLKSAYGNKIFIDALKDLGKPSLTNEIADKLKETNPKAIKKIENENNDVMRVLYNSAFHLSKEGMIKRKRVGKKLYEYSLKEWRRKPHNKRVAA